MSDSLAFGLAIVEMTESVAMRYVNGKYIRESDYVPPKASKRHVDHTWMTNRDLPSGRLRLLVYSPYRSVSWSTSLQESKARSLTTDIPQIVKAIENSTATVTEKLREAERQAEIWRQPQQAHAAGLLARQDRLNDGGLATEHRTTPVDSRERAVVWSSRGRGTRRPSAG